MTQGKDEKLLADRIQASIKSTAGDSYFRYTLQNENTGLIISKEFSYLELFNGECEKYIKSLRKYIIVSVGRRIGINDKNGVRIYEGDLVKYEGNSLLWLIYFDEKFLQFRMSNSQNFTYSLTEELGYYVVKSIREDKYGKPTPNQD